MNLTSRNSYIFKLFVAFSLLFAAIGGGRTYETACACAWRLRNENGFKGLWARTTIWLMDFFEEDHCKKSAMWYSKIQRGLKDGSKQIRG